MIHQVITEFVSRHVGDARIFDPTNETDIEELVKWGVSFQSKASLPDLIVHHRKRDWLFLMDATPERSHISESRKAELTQCFSECGKHLVMFSAFADRESFTPCIEWIASGTHVWFADNPDHMIHFNGERFLGPYSK